ncbi:MAG: serine hydrolase domain-containing protein, partial [Bacteroidota bacterium]
MKTTIAFLAGGILLLSACQNNPSSTESTATSAPNFDSLTIALREQADLETVPGFGVAIVNTEGTLYQGGFGYADIAEQKPYTTQSLQNIGSISKTFIGISLQQAVDRGLLDWDTPINDILPFDVVHPKYADQPILISHLASHTAGINDGDDYDFAYSLTEPNTYIGTDLDPEDIAEFEAYAQNPAYELGDFCQSFLSENGHLYKEDHFLPTAPGEQYEYSNVGAALAAHVLEVATGISFPQWTQKYILDPLKMGNSGWSFSDVNMDQHAQLYYERSLPIPRYTLATYPDGGFITCIEDLSKYLSAMIANYGTEENQLVSAGGLENIMTPRH